MQLVVAVASLLANHAIAQVHTGNLDGVTIVSNDPAQVKRVRSQFRPGILLTEFRQKLESPDIEIVGFGERSAVVFDLKSGPLGDLRDQSAFLQKLVGRIGRDLTFRVGDLGPAENNYAAEILSRFLRPEMIEGNYSSITAGLETLTRFSVEKDGKSVTLSAPQDQTVSSGRAERLAQSPIKRKELSREQSEFSLRSTKTSEKKLDELNFYYAGNHRSAVGDATKKVAEELDKLITRLEGERIAAAIQLMAASGLKGDQLPAGKVSLNELPKALVDKLTENIRDNFQLYGFGSADEAELFLRNSNGVSAFTSFGLTICERPGPPPVFGSYLFATIRGGKLP